VSRPGRAIHCERRIAAAQAGDDLAFRAGHVAQSLERHGEQRGWARDVLDDPRADADPLRGREHIAQRRQAIGAVRFSREHHVVAEPIGELDPLARNVVTAPLPIDLDADLHLASSRVRSLGHRTTRRKTCQALNLRIEVQSAPIRA